MQSFCSTGLLNIHRNQANPKTGQSKPQSTLFSGSAFFSTSLILSRRREVINRHLCFISTIFDRDVPQSRLRRLGELHDLELDRDEVYSRQACRRQLICRKNVDKMVYDSMRCCRKSLFFKQMMKYFEMSEFRNLTRKSLTLSLETGKSYLGVVTPEGQARNKACGDEVVFRGVEELLKKKNSWYLR